jgi:hypothetical protein
MKRGGGNSVARFDRRFLCNQRSQRGYRKQVYHYRTRDVPGGNRGAWGCRDQYVRTHFHEPWRKLAISAAQCPSSAATAASDHYHANRIDNRGVLVDGYAIKDCAADCANRCHWLAIFSMVYRRSGVNPSDVAPSRGVEVTGYVLTFLLGTYGGLFSERLRHTPYGAFCGDVPHDFYRGHRNHEADQCFFFGDCDSDFHAAWTGRLSTRCHSGSDDICGRATRSPFRPPPGEFVDPAHSFRGRLVVGAGDTSLRCVGLRHPPCETAHCSIVGCRDGYARVICATRPRLRPGARARPTKTYQYADKAEAIQKKCIKLDATLAVIMEFARGRAVLRPPSPSLARRAPPVRSPVQPLSRVPENRRRR